ncbi:unnamed protein product [Adineta steineri]|uniref:Uncharacterized protein n=1 Tax=Adineta steineri TaxID=433720 RepID=A0A814EYR2_9BILA|nr:unnamed protein product [Adineta steineri]
MSIDVDETLNITERWRKRLEIKYKLIINGHEEARGVGSKYERIPEGSNDRYAQWANNLTEEQLYTQDKCRIHFT